MKKNQEVIELIGKIDKWGGFDRSEDLLSIGDQAICELDFGHGDEIYVTYFTSDVELTKEEFVKNHLLTVFGAPEIYHYPVHGSEYTGYMWSDQKFKVGNHDLYKELLTYHGKYCYMKIYRTKAIYRDKKLERLLNKDSNKDI